MTYDHATHAGNAGDVFKHLLLAEAASALLSQIGPGGSLIYTESHAGAPGYRLSPGDQWISGIARLWPPSEDLGSLTYFKVLLGMNESGLRYYPGSASIVMEAATLSGLTAQADLWDTSPAVALSWTRFDHRPHLVRFHSRDGFSGVQRLLFKSHPGLLLVDSPGTDPRDIERARDLIIKAAQSGWVAMSWHIQPYGCKTLITASSDGSEKLDAYSLDFADAGMDGGRWPGCTVLISGADPEMNDRLADAVNIFLQCR